MIFTTCGIFTVYTTSNCVARALRATSIRLPTITPQIVNVIDLARTTAVQSTIGHSLFIIITLGTRCKCYVVIFVYCACELYMYKTVTAVFISMHVHFN